MRYNDTLLDSLRTVGDPIPDRIIEELARDGQINQVNQIMRQLFRNSHPVPSELPENIQAWLRSTDQLPAWADKARLDRAATMFVEYGRCVPLILSTSSLVECYAARKGCKALSFSYRLGHNTKHRLAETAQFLLVVMTPGAFDENGGGIPAIQKVRLMHAAIRFLIRKSGRWNEADMDVPICQEDLLGTLMAFSHIVLRDLRKLGAQFNDEEASDYFYLWQVVGEMMGCRPDVIPASVDEGHELWEAICRRQQGPSPEGVAMTQALLDFHADLIPGEMFDGLVPALVRELVGDQIADWMEVPHSRLQTVVRYKTGIGQVLDCVDRCTGFAGDMVDRLALSLITRKSVVLNDYQRAGFEIPTKLREAWGIDAAELVVV
jgi:hypothetical protein